MKELSPLELPDHQNRFIVTQLMKKFPEIYSELAEEFEVSPHGELAAILASISGIRDGKKIRAIKEVREILNLGLKEAKDYVESFQITPTNNADNWHQTGGVKPEALARLAYYEDKYPEYFV